MKRCTPGHAITAGLDRGVLDTTAEDIAALVWGVLLRALVPEITHVDMDLQGPATVGLTLADDSKWTLCVEKSGM